MTDMDLDNAQKPIIVLGLDYGIKKMGMAMANTLTAKTL